MSNVANSSISLQVSSNAAVYQFSFSGAYAMTGAAAGVLSQNVGGSSWAAVSIGAAATIAKLAIKTLTPAATGTKVQVSLNNTGTQILSDVLVGEGILLCFPPATIYVKSDATGSDTIPIQIAVAER